ncbi:CRISPR-associated endonuclease Cas3'' [Govanella unica]|uniref:CRISPR-associated endonuclease Cas3 n=1 Tax=Govanella unica TaxID=2975056 RepID=A0A9X3Z7T5_9PROT|nr:CRISPR-associated endonuclease Cas3'' [Govania unica]MDA5194522.1 CRISPR-associated endonuclease Cas3'' [Govania unica]
MTEHLSAVGATAGRFAASFGAETAGKAMGLLHDIGKRSLAYQSYIRTPLGHPGLKGPDHSSAGAKEALAVYGPQYGRLLAFGIAGHHSGLMDGAGYEGKGSSLRDRLEKTVEPYDGWQDHVVDLPSLQQLKDGLLRPKPNAIGKGFPYAFLMRMMFSCLVDADFLETERFYATSSGAEPPARGGVIGLRHLEAIRAHMARHRKDDSEVNCLRSEILDYANGKAALSPGLFTLTVPTGGGKTLTSLSFALEHALRHDLRRIVYVIPFTSIIEQTAEVFRDALKTPDDILEHHSNFDWDRKEVASNDVEHEGAAGLAKLRRDAENWDAPIVVTTAVQFFESLFAARTSRARKLHNLAKSVIILDEAQSIPVKLLRPSMAVIDELARNYGATVILCTATQPALRLQDEALPLTKTKALEGLDISDERELAPDPRGLYTKLKRVKLDWRREPLSDADIAAGFAEQPQMLCIVNSRAHARDLFTLLRDQEQMGAVHLTTLMCAKHRRTVLAKVREDLKAGHPVRLVATSLIEAGVDVDFPEVWRAATGLSSIAQAAGRCNREGRLPGLGRTVVFESAEHKTPPVIEAFYGPAREMLRRKGEDALSLESITAYYRLLYSQHGIEGLDAASLNEAKFPIIPAIDATVSNLNFPFSQIEQAFRMIDDVMEPVIVPWDEDAVAAINALQHAEFPPAGVQRKLQQYVVPVPAKARAAMLAVGAVQAVRPEDYGARFVVLENLSLYDSALGLKLDDPTWRSSESNIFS